MRSTVFSTESSRDLSPNAQVLAQTQRLIARLQSALESRAVIDQAIGIWMGRSGCTE
ncbi:MAG TPA: ANTAR domain-containing protein, partial [Mycobacterium sp.]